MTREEQIRYACKHQKFSLFANYGDAFIAGAHWADNHPTSPWHDASEVPDRNYKSIIYQQKYCSMFNINIAYLPTCVRSCKMTQKNWEEFVRENNINRWAFIDELLPKTQEL